ncbi:MAG: NUDIX domain-containing protein [Actinomycetota bacterium]
MELEGRPRGVCGECGRVSYHNPLPVATAVVLNDRREVLLVRRRNEPHSGKWCLPTGFAELDETIEEAVLRELREETGIEGRVHRLLTARSVADHYYGDLLFVCFEVEKTGGNEAPGDDAEMIAYHSLSALPPLAFDAHTEAVRVCEALYLEPWAIQDSFTRLYSDTSEGMLSDALVRLVEERADEICDRWLEVIRHNPTTPSYGRFDLTEVRRAAREALSQFCAWLLEEGRDEEPEAFYAEVGRRRASQGFGLWEVISALTLLRKEIWAFAREHQVLASPMDVYRVMELSRRIVHFFDKALFHTARGYLAAGPS